MVIGEARNLLGITLFCAPDTSGSASFGRPRVHDYSGYEQDVDYVFDAIDSDGIKGYMTGQKKGIQTGDYIVLTQNNSLIRYLVERIEYYASPADTWIALLSQTTYGDAR